MNVSVPESGPGGLCPGRATVFNSEGPCTSGLHCHNCLSFPYCLVGDEHWHHWWSVSVPPVRPVTGEEACVLM
jgi:hypothetical protein